MDKRTFIHIGSHKTGTTFIQNEIFPKLESVDLIRAWNTHRYLFNPNFENIDKHILITDEGISGNPFGGRYFEEFKFNITRIKHLYREPKIIFGIRRHDGFLLSLYKQYLHQKGFQKIDYLFNKEDTGLMKHKDLFFENKIEILKEQFKDVFIYSQELLKENPQEFIANLMGFLDINDEINYEELITRKRNVGVETRLQVVLLKRLNKLSHSNYFPNLYSDSFQRNKITPRDLCQNYLKSVKSKKFELSPNLKDYIINHFKDDWQKSIRHV